MLQLGKVFTEDKFDSVVCTSYLVSAPQVQRPTHGRASLVSALHPLTLLGWKVGGPLGIIKDGNSLQPWGQRDGSAIKSNYFSCRGP